MQKVSAYILQTRVRNDHGYYDIHGLSLVKELFDLSKNFP